MSDTPTNEAPAAPVPSAGEPSARSEAKRSGYLGPLPVWLWIVLIAIVVIVLIIIGVELFSGGRGPSAAGSPSPTESSASPTPSVTPTSTPTGSATPTPSGNPNVDQGTFDSALPDYLSDTLNSQNTAVLSEGGTFSNPVFVMTADGSAGRNMTPDDAVDAMQSMFTPEDPNPWDLALPDATLAGYRAGPFGAYFPVGAIVARSHDGHVFSFIGHDSTITTMFMASSEGLLH